MKESAIAPAAPAPTLSRPPMVALQVLLGILWLGCVAAAISAVVEIETIIFSGPLLGGASLLYTVVSYYWRHTFGFYFGVGTTSLAVACFCLILGLHWSPQQAQLPISLLIGATVAGALTPLGGVALLTVPTVERQRPWMQFGIGDLLWLMAWCSLPLGGYSLLAPSGGFSVLDPFRQPAAVAVAIAIAYVTLLAYVLMKYHRRSGMSTLSTPAEPRLR